MVDKRLQRKVDKLLRRIVKRLDLEKDNYIVKVNGRIKARYANADIWIWLNNKSERFINIAKFHVKKKFSKEIIRTLIHEIAHFKQMEKMIEAVGSDVEDIDNYRKSRPTTYNWEQPHWHNIDFDNIYANLLYEYKCRTTKGKGLKGSMW